MKIIFSQTKQTTIMINIDDRLLREELPHIGADAFTVLCFIASHLGKKKTAWPGKNRIQKACTTLSNNGDVKKMSDRKFYAVTSKLIDRGLISRTQQRTHGEFSKTIYTVTTEYISIYAPAKNFELEESPHMQKCRNGKSANTQKPRSGKRLHISINKERSINKIESAHEEKETPKQPTLQTDWKPAANEILTDSDAVRQIKEQSGHTESIKQFTKEYFLNMVHKGEWYNLTVPTNPGEKHRWKAKRIAGISKWILNDAKFYPKRKKADQKPEPLPSYLKSGFDYSTLSN